MSRTTPTIDPFTAGLRCVCPRCGNGRLFDGFLTLVSNCATCGLPLARFDSGDGPAVFLIFILGSLVIPLALWVSSGVSWPLWVHGLVWGIVTMGLTVGMLRPAKALVVALEFRHRRHEYENEGEA